LIKSSKIFELALVFGFVAFLASSTFASASGIDDLKSGIGNALGISAEAGGLLVGVMILASAGILTSLGCNLNALVTAIVMFGVTAILSIIGLLPSYVAILFFIVLAALFARFVSGYLSGYGGGGGEE